MNKQRKYQKKMHEQGRCRICGKPLKTTWHCEKHAKMDNERIKRNYHNKKQGAKNENSANQG